MKFPNFGSANSYNVERRLNESSLLKTAVRPQETQAA